MEGNKVVVGTTESLEEYNKKLYEIGRTNLCIAFVWDIEEITIKESRNGNLGMASEWIFEVRNRRNDLHSSKTGPENQLSKVQHQQD